MDRQIWMIICGVAALGIYLLSFFFRIMHWPYQLELKLLSLLPFLIGVGILLYDRMKKAKAQGRTKSKQNGWEDILGDDDSTPGQE